MTWLHHYRTRRARRRHLRCLAFASRTPVADRMRRGLGLNLARLVALAGVRVGVVAVVLLTGCDAPSTRDLVQEAFAVGVLCGRHKPPACCAEVKTWLGSNRPVPACWAGATRD
jgi:hypothetical protein